MENLVLPTPRRSFLQRFAAGTAALLASGWAPAHAAPAPRARTARRVSDDAWLERIRGEHRQVFDLVETNMGFGAAYALNFIDSFKEAHDVENDDLTAVLVFRHFAMPLLLNDGMWAKYKIGGMLHANDPDTNAPAERNLFHANVPMRPGLTYAQMFAEQPVIVVACGLALSVLSGLAAPNAGVSAEEAKAEWAANLFPGVYVAPSGVYAVNRAQEHGCTYCYAG
ncbi:MAG TPA: hypothetical protein VD962_02045 [Rubricoccaceae bacterium]|nr:hypothetical protein [Rubricoccaceae bacterium]